MFSRAGGSDGVPAHWLVQLLRPQRAQLDVKRSLRAAVGIAGPIAVGLLIGELQLGMLVSIGSLSATLALAPGSYRYRARRLCAVSGSALVGFLLGGSLGGYGWWTVPLLGGLAVLSALASVGSNVSSLAGLQLLVFGVVGTAEAAQGVPPPLLAACFATGAVWLLLLTVGAWPVHPVAPERAMVSEVYRKAAELLEAIGSHEAQQARQRLTTSMNTAYDALLTVRSRLHGRDRAYRRLLVLLTAATPIIETGVALLHARTRPPRRTIEAVRALAEAIDAGTAAADTDLPTSDSPALRGLRAGIMDARALLTTQNASWQTDQRRPRHTARTRLRRVLDRLTPGRSTWLFALRLAVCMMLAEVFAELVHPERAYWTALTVAIVLKPDFGSVFARAVQRGGGTVVGAAIGSLVVILAPPGWLLVALVFVVAAMLPVGQVRNYGMFTTFVTPLVLIQQDLLHGGDWSTLLARLGNTVLGCVLVLLFGYLLWPGSRKPRLSGRMAEVVAALSSYMERALVDPPDGSAVLRRRAYRTLSDLRTDFQRLLAEPSRAGRQVAESWPAIVALERAIDAVTRCGVEIRHGAQAPRPSEVQTLMDAAAAIARRLESRRTPERLDLPETEQLAGIRKELSTVYTLLRGDGR